MAVRSEKNFNISLAKSLSFKERELKFWVEKRTSSMMGIFWALLFKRSFETLGTILFSISSKDFSKFMFKLTLSCFKEKNIPNIEADFFKNANWGDPITRYTITR